MKHYFLPAVLSLLATLSLLHAEPLPIDFVTVRDEGNIPDTITGLGAVAAPYQIGKYEVTVAQWCGFLNAVAYKEDPHELYNEAMTSDPTIACIRHITASGMNVYIPISKTDHFPITYVSYNNALRFCNWYQNGMPTDLQGHKAVEASTEKGAYTFIQLENGTEQAVLNTNAVYTLATEDQWMKAAYYAGDGTNSGYYLYSTKNNNAPNIGATDISNEANWDTTSYASFWTGSEPRKNPVLTSVDHFAQTMSAYQVCDMGGNVNEWMMHTNEADPSSPLPITRGGSWASMYCAPDHWALSVNDLMRTASAQVYDSSFSEFTQGNNRIGFRLVCSVVPSESTAEATESFKNGSTSSSNVLLQQASNTPSGITAYWNGLTWYEKAAVIAAAAILLGVAVWFLWSMIATEGASSLIAAESGGDDYIMGEQGITKYDDFGNEIPSSETSFTKGKGNSYALKKSGTRLNVFKENPTGEKLG